MHAVGHRTVVCLRTMAFATAWLEVLLGLGSLARISGAFLTWLDRSAAMAVSFCVEMNGCMYVIPV